MIAFLLQSLMRFLFSSQKLGHSPWRRQGRGKYTQLLAWVTDGFNERICHPAATKAGLANSNVVQAEVISSHISSLTTDFSCERMHLDATTQLDASGATKQYHGVGS